MAAWSFNRGLMSESPRSSDSERERDENFALKGGRAGGGKASQGLGGRLFARLRRVAGAGGSSKPSGGGSSSADLASDPRQRAIVKLHYFNHADGGGAALGRHGDYLERESARLEQTDPHASYLSREERLGFYDAIQDGVDGGARLRDWARADPRHFRIILAPENGEALTLADGGDLKSYVRETMARAEAAIGRKLDWVAVNHFDTDNAHAHIVLRARDGDGKVLGLRRDFVRREFREIARDVATERLGPRGPADARRALESETRAHRLTRLDRLIGERLDGENRVRIADLGKGLGDPDLAQAIKARATELTRMGLAAQSARGALRFAHDWRQRLQAMEAHADIRRRLLRERADARRPQGRGKEAARGLTYAEASELLARETGKPFRGLSQTMQTWSVRGEMLVEGKPHLMLERHDRTALAPKPPGGAIAAGDKIMAGMKGGAPKVMPTIGVDR